MAVVSFSASQAEAFQQLQQRHVEAENQLETELKEREESEELSAAALDMMRAGHEDQLLRQQKEAEAERARLEKQLEVMTKRCNGLPWVLELTG